MFFSRRTNDSSSQDAEIGYDPVTHLNTFSSEDVWKVNSLNLTVEVLMLITSVMNSRRIYKNISF